MTSRLFRLVVSTVCLASLVPAQSEDSYNANERILRIRQLGKKDPSVLPALTPYLSEGNRDIRIEAVKAIVRVGSEQSLDPLVKATHDNDAEVQIRATDGIVNFYLPGYVVKSGLTGPLTRGVRQVKGFFASRNDQMVDPDVQIRTDVAQAIADLISNGAGYNVRANAALAAGILRDRPALPALEAALHAKDSDLIFESLVSLQKLRDPSAGSEVSFLTHELDERIQVTALETVGLLRSLSSAPDVRLALNSARNVKVKRAALQALATFGIPDDRALFLQYSADRDVELRASALAGLGRIREPEDFPVLQAAFDEGEIDWRIHLAAAFAMVDEGKVDTEEFSPLPYLLENLHNRGRKDAASAYLTELVAREDVRTALIKIIPQSDKDQKIALCAILGSAGTPDVIPVLTSLSKDIDPDIVFAASKALRTAQSRRLSSREPAA